MILLSNLIVEIKVKIQSRNQLREKKASFVPKKNLSII